jgi:ubiquinone/menaquinone biosynthesis C-methylase UbiE
MEPPLSPSTDLFNYYDARLAEYEEVYAKPERQNDLLRLRQLLHEDVENAHLLEIACGTGYWTHVASCSASDITATDISESALDFARRKTYNCSVSFMRANAYDIAHLRDFSATLSMFWWSHIPITQLPVFLRAATETTLPGGKLIFADNRYVEGSSTRIARTDSDGNTYQLRKLKSGLEHEVVKNFPTKDYIRELLDAHCSSIRTIELEYYWYASCDLTIK